MTLRTTKISLLTTLLFMFGLMACTNLDITMPKGPKGDTGLSAYEVWKESVLNGTVEWPKNEVEIPDFFKFLKGKDGVNGTNGIDGVNGKSAYDIWKETIASGEVDDPHNPGQKWNANKNSVQDFWIFLTGATGENGQTPHIGDNGHWWIGTTDTGIPAQGEPGTDGQDAVPPTVTIGENGNWFINGVDTNKPAFGKDGANGTNGSNGTNGANGKSAYELWKESVEAGCDGSGPQVMDPHNPGLPWDCEKTSLNDFWEFLRGSDGKDGENAPIVVEVGKYNVLPQYWNAELAEYVVPSDGSVIFQVYDKSGAIAPAGAVVKGLPGVDQNLEFTTDNRGLFKVPAAQLPNLKILAERKGITASVTINGVTEPSAANTMVPNRVNTRLKVTQVYPSNWGTNDPVIRVSYKIERQVNGVWNLYPNDIPKPAVYVGLVKNIAQPVDEANVLSDAETSQWRRTYGTDFVYIARPYVLTPSEKVYVQTPAGANSNQKKFEWDGTNHYFAIFFGDNNGSNNDYGQKVFAEDKMWSPEVNPICGLKNIKLEIKQGVSTLWGEFDVDQLSYFYPVGSYVKDATSLIWSPNGGQVAARDISDSYYLRLAMTTNVSGTTGTVYASSKRPIFVNSRFKLVSAYPNNSIQIMNSSNGYYRDYYAYYLRQNTSTGEYFLENYYDAQQKVTVPVEDCPDDFLN